MTSVRIARYWPEFLVALVLPDDNVAARAVSIPFDADKPGRESLPDGGWDAVILWAIDDLLDGRKPTSACALEIAVAPQYRGQNLSAVRR